MLVGEAQLPGKQPGVTVPRVRLPSLPNLRKDGAAQLFAK